MHSKKLKEGRHLQDLHVDGRMRYVTKIVWRGVEVWLRQCQGEVQLMESVSAVFLDIRVYLQGGGDFYLVDEFMNQIQYACTSVFIKRGDFY